MITFPPSPALSACDSLAGIEDLDAFLDAQGALSQWPTPPIKNERFVPFVAEIERDIDSPPQKDEKIIALVTEVECDTDGEVDEDEGEEAYRIAAVFSTTVCMGVVADPTDTELILGVLVRAEMPHEVLALAFNILKAANLGGRLLQLEHGDYDATPELWVTAALSLAALWIYEEPPTWTQWSRDVVNGAWTAHQIDIAQFELNVLLDWRTHILSTPPMLETALLEIYPLAKEERLASEMFKPRDEPSHTRTEAVRSMMQKLFAPLKLVCSNTSTRYVHGELTPLDSPTSSYGRYLRLL